MKVILLLAALCALAAGACAASHRCDRWSAWSRCVPTAGGASGAAGLARAACAQYGAHARERRAVAGNFWGYVSGLLAKIKERIAARTGLDVQQPEPEEADAVRERNEAQGGSMDGAPDQSDAAAEADRVAGITAEEIAARQSPSIQVAPAPPPDALLSRVNDGMVAFRDRATSADEQGIAVGETVGDTARFDSGTAGRVDKIKSKMVDAPEAPSVGINKESVFNKDTSGVAKRSVEPQAGVSVRCCLDSVGESAPSEWRPCDGTGQ